MATKSIDLEIEHLEGSRPPSFRVTRLPNPKSTKPVTLRSPYTFPVGATPKPLMPELRWYLEKFLEYPFDPETTRAEHVQKALRDWGTECFSALFDNRQAGSWLKDADTLQIRADDAQILSWHWEALYDPQAGAHVAHQRCVERRLNKLDDPPQPITLPGDRVNILLVVCRPYDNDVTYRSIARPLIELIQSKNLPAHVDVLRPPTFDQLREHLRAHPGYYHVLHFDGHGGYGNHGGQPSPHQFQSAQGHLLFETDKGEPDPKSARDLSALLREHAVPAAVLNACQGATLDEKAEDAFASVATALLQSGTRSVVAMAYAMYVSGAQVFLPAFYRRLFETGSMLEAGRAGRQQMLANSKRVSARGPYDLQDWVLPVVYQQDPPDFGFAQQAKPEKRQSRLPKEILEEREEYGFIGRDGAILKMERALHRQAPCIVIQGLGGIGKTTLARGFLRWLDQTGGLDGALWLDFRDIRTAEYVINRTGGLFFGENFRFAKNKLELLDEKLGEYRVLMVWDNFESAAQNLTAEDRSELSRFLQAIRSKRSKVIITSRSPEEWLSPSLRMEIRLGGLGGEERWEHCEAILQNLGLKVNRNDPELIRLVDQLAGHPVAMRVVLPKLERTAAGKVWEALRDNIAELGLSEREEEGRLFGTLRFVEQDLDEELRPLMTLVALHEGYLNADLLAEMARQVDSGWTRQRIDRLMAALAPAGLARQTGAALYELHPLLTSYLRSRGDAPESCQRAFVNVMASLADDLGPLPWHEQRVPFLLFGACFYFALKICRRLGMEIALLTVTQSLGVWALNSRNFKEASRLFAQLAEHAVNREESEPAAAAYQKLGVVAQDELDFSKARDWYLKSLAISEKDGYLYITASTYHQLGRIAEQERDFRTARDWYLKSLAIKEKLGNLHGAGLTYHQLGSIAQEERAFSTAREWHLKSLAISEKEGDLPAAAGTYHHLGMIAEKEGDLKMAREWYLKSLAISEKHGILQAAAGTYHHLGMITEKAGDLEMAREWYLKSLAISEKQGNLHAAAATYQQLGRVAHEERDFSTAKGWYLKSLDISEKQGELNSAATTYYHLGNLSLQEGNIEAGGRLLVQALAGFLRTRNSYFAQFAANDFFVTFRQASAEEKAKLRSMWEEANIGPFTEGKHEPA